MTVVLVDWGRTPKQNIFQNTFSGVADQAHGERLQMETFGRKSNLKPLNEPPPIHVPLRETTTRHIYQDTFRLMHSAAIS